MAFVEGESLHAKVAAAGPVSAKEAALLIRKVAEAVEFAHDKGIVHRDIKPHNVLLDENSEPRVTDFGLAKQLHGGSELTATGQVMGTPSYMSPEQAAGRIEEVGVASDVYSLGATLYYLLTSRPPFQAASMMETVRQVIDAEPAPLRRLNSDVPRDLETICLKYLRKESSKRYATAAELAHDLSRWLENKPITARPVSQTEKAWLWCKRRPAVASLLVALVFLAVVGTFVVKQREYQQEAGALVDRLITADTEDVPKLVAEMKPHWDAVAPLLQQAETEAAKGSDLKKLLHIRLALVRTNPSHVDYLFDRLLAAKVDEVPVIVELLSHWLDELEEQLWESIETGNSGQRIRAAAALAAYNSGNDQWKQNAEDVVTALVSVPSSESDEWTSMLRPVGSTLVDVLEQRFRDRSSVRDAERPLVAAALADHSPTKPLLLKELILLADNEREFQPLLMVLRNHKQLVVPELNSLLGQSAPEEVEPEQRDALLKKQANAAVCLLALGKPDSVWPLFRQRSDPSLRSFLIDRVARLGVNHEVLASRIKQESDPASRYALVSAMGQFDLGKLSSQRKRSVVQQFVALSRDTRDPGIHSAAGWALRNWQQHQVVEQIDKELAIAAHVEGQHWFVNSQGQTFAVVDGPVEFSMGEKTETAAPTLVTISHRFAVATHEVTVAQFQRFRSDHEHDAKFARKLDCPVNMVSWFDAVTYCNWLSQQDGIPHDQWCYEPNAQGNYAIGMKIPADFLERTGYRLPTREEWEFVCRGGTTSNYGFGEPLELVTKYA
jgi:formylglycine-generating enzyme required for sulfatase activity